MKRQWRLALVALAISASGAAILAETSAPAQVSAQSAFTSPEGDFTVSFPVSPEVSSHTPAGKFDSGFRTYVAEDHGATFSVRVDQFPSGIPVPKPTQRSYELTLRGHAVEHSSRLVSTGPALLSGQAAMQGEFTTESGATERMRILTLGHLVYQVSYAHPDGVGAPGDGDAFLDSFRIMSR